MSNLLSQASLVMIPSGYKEDIVYSAVPTDGSGDLSFTRASNGTRINSAGLVEVCPWNFVEQSNTFNTTWVSAGSGATITSGQTDPNSGSNAWLLSKLGQTGRIQQTVNVGGVQTFFIFAKKNTSDYILINVFDGTTSHECWFNLSTGVVGTQNSSTGTIESFGNGWFKCSVTSTNLVASGIIQIYQSDGNGNVTGTSGSIFIFNSQLNIGSTAKPYFPTTDRLNVPRLTYQNGGGGCPSLLLEKQSTNLAFPSEDLTAWTAGGMTNTANITTSPDGTQNADKSTIGSTTRYYDVVTNAITTVNATTYTTSFFAKKGTGIEAIYWYQLDGNRIAKWNLNNGAYIGNAPSDGYGAFTSYGSENLGNGWYRFYATYTATTTTTYVVIGISTNTNDSVTPISGNGTDFVYVWGLQYEASSYATSYIPTTSASATRVADACSKTGISSLIGQTEGVLFIDYNYDAKPDVNGNLPMVIYDGSNEAYIFITGGGDLRLELYNGGVLQCLLTTSIGAVGRKKIAFAYKQNDFVGYMNGVQVATDTSGTVASMSNLYVGSYYTANYNANGGINQALLFKTRLSNSDLIALTTI